MCTTRQSDSHRKLGDFQKRSSTKWLSRKMLILLASCCKYLGAGLNEYAQQLVSVRWIPQIAEREKKNKTLLNIYYYCGDKISFNGFYLRDRMREHLIQKRSINIRVSQCQAQKLIEMSSWTRFFFSQHNRPCPIHNIFS